MSQSDYLAHYGVPGMKWGVRKDRRASGSGSKKRGKSDSSLAGRTTGKATVSKAQASPSSAKSKLQARREERKAVRDVKKQRKEDARKRTLLSDKELDAKIERLSKEKRLKELTDSEVSPGNKFVKDITGTTGRKIAVAALTTAMATVVANKLGGEVGVGRAAADFYKQSTKTK